MSSVGSPLDAQRGTVDGAGMRVAIITARFHAEITDSLLEGAVSALIEHGVSKADVTAIRVPGAWELPQTAARTIATGRFDAIVTLGCVVRGETPHFDYVCQEATLGVGAVARTADIPVVFGVLTTDDLAQARARSGQGEHNKGYESAMAALEMVAVYRSLAGAS